MKLSSHKPERGYEPELSLTSMIDVVFLLLVFFIATASFVRTERELHSSIRFKAAGSERVNNDLEPAAVYVQRSAGGGANYRVGNRTFDAPAALQSFLLANFQNAPDGAFVFVEQGVPFDWAAAAIHACEQANLGGVSYVPL